MFNKVATRKARSQGRRVLGSLATPKPVSLRNCIWLKNKITKKKHKKIMSFLKIMSKTLHQNYASGAVLATGS